MTMRWPWSTCGTQSFPECQRRISGGKLAWHKSGSKNPPVPSNNRSWLLVSEKNDSASRCLNSFSCEFQGIPSLGFCVSCLLSWYKVIRTCILNIIRVCQCQKCFSFVVVVVTSSKWSSWCSNECVIQTLCNFLVLLQRASPQSLWQSIFQGYAFLIINSLHSSLALKSHNRVIPLTQWDFGRELAPYLFAWVVLQTKSIISCHSRCMLRGGFWIWTKSNLLRFIEGQTHLAPLGMPKWLWRSMNQNSFFKPSH